MMIGGGLGFLDFLRWYTHVQGIFTDAGTSPYLTEGIAGFFDQYVGDAGPTILMTYVARIPVEIVARGLEKVTGIMVSARVKLYTSLAIAMVWPTVGELGYVWMPGSAHPWDVFGVGIAAAAVIAGNEIGNYVVNIPSEAWTTFYENFGNSFRGFINGSFFKRLFNAMDQRATQLSMGSGSPQNNTEDSAVDTPNDSAVAQMMDSELTPAEKLAQPVAAAMKGFVDDKIVNPLEKSVADACGKPSTFAFPFGAGDGHDEDQDSRQHEKDRKQQIRDSKGTVHMFSPFFANNTLPVNRSPDVVPPTSIASQFGLSTDVNNGATTPTARSTFPALSKILDNRSNWDRVNIGSLGAMNMIPERFITSDSITSPQIMSTNFSFFPPAFAQGFGLAQKVYAESPELRRGADDGGAPSGGPGVRCNVLTVAAKAAQKSAELFGQSYKVPWKVISGVLSSQKSGSGSPPPPPVDEYEKELQSRYKRIALLAFLASILRSSDPCNKAADYYDQLKQSLYENTLGFYKSTLSNVYSADTFVNNNPSLSDAIKRSLGYFGEVGKCQAVGQCVTNIWDATKKSATDLSAGAGLSALIPSTKLKKVLPGNPNYKPYLEIMKKAVSEYSIKHPSKVVTYRVPQRNKLDEEYMLSILTDKQIANPYNKSNTTTTALSLIFDSFKSPEDYYYCGSKTECLPMYLKRVFSDALKEDNKESLGQSVNASATYENEIDIESIEIRGITSFISRTYRETGKPVENDKILAYALEESNGDLSKAILYVNVFYKSFARGFTWQLDVIHNEILDEFNQDIPWSALNTAKPPEIYNRIASWSDQSNLDYDLSWHNRIGSAYHATNLILLSKNFSPSIIAMMVLGEYIPYGSQHGLGKQITDVAVLKDLYEIDSYLSQFNPDSSRPWPPACR